MASQAEAAPAAHPRGGALFLAWRWFCRMVVRIHYRRCEGSGLERLPSAGPVLLCANHPSAFLDPVILQALIARPVHPLARAGLFRNPLLRPVLALIQAVPVHRRQDTGDAAVAGRNVSAFDTCTRMFAEGRTLLIFPEGVSHSSPRLREVKTGAARLALEALEKNGHAPTMLPVGLNFSEVGRFRSSVFVLVGAPVPVEIQSGEASEAAAVRLTGEIRDALSAITLNLEAWGDYDLVRRLERFFALRRGKYRRRNLAQRFRVLQKLADAQARIREQAPELVARAAERLTQFERLCGRFGVRDYHLTVAYSPGLVARFIARSLAIILLGIPVAAWGFVNAIVPYLLTGACALKTSTDRYHYDTAKVLFGMLFFGLFWGGQTVGVYLTLGPWPAVAYALTLPPSAAAAQYMRRERERILDNIRVFFLFIRNRELRELLESRRTELEKELADLARLAIHEEGMA